MRKKKVDYENWHVITTMEEFEEVAWLVITKQIQFAMVYAPPGLAKTQTIERLIRRAHRQLGYTPVVAGRGTASAKGFFRLIQKNKDVPIIGDDLDVAMNRSAEFRALVRALTDTGSGPRTITWDKEMKDLDRRCDVTCSLLLTFNQMNMSHPEIAAIANRAAIKVRFAPPPREIQDGAQYWSCVQEVFDYWSCCLPFMTNPNLRCLKNGERIYLSSAKLHDWRTAILDDVDLLAGSQKAVLVAHLSGRYKNTKRLFDEFVVPNAAITACQRSVYDWVKEFRETWEREIVIGLRVRGRVPQPEEPPSKDCNSAKLQDCSPPSPNPTTDSSDEDVGKAIDDVFRDLGIEDWPGEG